MRSVVDRNVAMRRVPVFVNVIPSLVAKYCNIIIIIIIIIITIMPCCFYLSGLLHLMYTYTNFIL
jgi:hypothetical protein